MIDLTRSSMLVVVVVVVVLENIVMHVWGLSIGRHHVSMCI